MGLVSCNKTQVKITSTDYYMQSMNTCGLSGSGENGSVFYFRVICNVLPEEGMTALVRYEYEGGPVSQEYEVEYTQEYIENDIFWMRSCNRFGNHDYVDVHFRIQTADGEISEKHTMRITKPFGAN